MIYHEYMYEECHLTLVTILFSCKIIPTGHGYHVSISWFQQVPINSISFAWLCSLSSSMRKTKIRLLQRIQCTALLTGVSNLCCWNSSSFSKFNFKLLFSLFCFRNSLIRTSTQIKHMREKWNVSLWKYFYTDLRIFL